MMDQRILLAVSVCTNSVSSQQPHHLMYQTMDQSDS
jgi:hypothetical protein